MSDSKLKSGWRFVKLGEVVKNANLVERDPEANGIEKIVGLEHIDSENLHIRRWNSVADGTSFSRKFVPGQTLFGKRRAYQRKVAFAEFEGICSGDILTFEPKNRKVLMPDLLPFICQSDAFFDHALDTSAGSLSPRTSWTALKDFEFPLPSLEEQKRIAAILWTADEAVEGFNLAAEQILKAKITFFHERLGIASIKEFRFAANRNDSRLSNDVPIVSVAELGDPNRQTVQVGPFGGSLSSKHFKKSGVRVLKINNITEDGHLDLSSSVFVSEKHADSLSRYKVQAGDLITAAQATTGRSTLVGGIGAESLISQHLIRVALNKDKCLPEYLLACFHSPLLKHQIDAVKSKTTRDGLNTEDVAGFRIPLPNISEQRKIVSCMFAFDTQADEIRQNVMRLKSFSKLILARLFDSSMHEASHV